MTEPKPFNESFLDINAAMAALDEERRRLAEISRIRREETTTVHAKDKSVSMTFDGSGELTELKFNGNKYRSMAPAELASLLIETVKLGRSRSMAKMTELMSSDSTPGIDIAGIASGKVDPSEVIDSLLNPMLDQIPGGAHLSADKESRHG